VTEEALPSLSQIYESYHGRVVAYAGKLLGREEADDVAQEVFVKVGRSLNTLTDPSSLTPWIYAITLNTVRDTIRKRRAGPDGFTVPASTSGVDGETEPAVARIADTRSRTPEEVAARNEMVACYLDFVRKLPARYYDVYVLSEFDNLSNDEIASRLSLTLSTAKIRLHRARAMLNAELRKNCRCYHNERGELMGEPKPT
jgi:RNA polymerase sigma-70 factor (ECF subfamily)